MLVQDFERDLVEQRKANEEQAGSGWQKVENGEQKPAELTTEQEPTTGLEEEPVLNSGLAAALGLAAKKGKLIVIRYIVNCNRIYS